MRIAGFSISSLGVPFLLAAALSFLTAGCIHWPDAPRMESLAAPAATAVATVEKAHPDAVVIGPVYRLTREGRWGSERVTTVLVFEDGKGGPRYRARIGPDSEFEVHRLRYVDALPPRLHERFFEFRTLGPGGTIAGPIRVIDNPDPFYEFEFDSESGRSLGRINESGSSSAAYLLR